MSESDKELMMHWSKGSAMTRVYNRTALLSELEPKRRLVEAYQQGWRMAEEGASPMAIPACRASAEADAALRAMADEMYRQPPSGVDEEKDERKRSSWREYWFVVNKRSELWHACAKESCRRALCGWKPSGGLPGIRFNASSMSRSRLCQLCVPWGERMDIPWNDGCDGEDSDSARSERASDESESGEFETESSSESD